MRGKEDLCAGIMLGYSHLFSNWRWLFPSDIPNAGYTSKLGRLQPRASKSIGPSLKLYDYWTLIDLFLLMPLLRTVVIEQFFSNFPCSRNGGVLGATSRNLNPTSGVLLRSKHVRLVISKHQIRKQSLIYLVLLVGSCITISNIVRKA